MEESQQSRPIVVAIITILLIPVIYAASFGPACMLTKRGYLTREDVAMAYRPALEQTPWVIHEGIYLFGWLWSDKTTSMTICQDARWVTKHCKHMP